MLIEITPKDNSNNKPINNDKEYILAAIVWKFDFQWYGIELILEHATFIRIDIKCANVRMQCNEFCDFQI